MKCDSLYTKVAFLWGDGIKDIIQQCQKEKKVYIYIQLYTYTSIILLKMQKSIPDDIDNLLQKIQIYLQSQKKQS